MPNPYHDPANGRFTSKSGAGPTKLNYIRNNNGIRKHAAPGAFGQNVEPWGQYMSEDTAPSNPLQKGWERGKVSFSNPIVLDHADGGWKSELSAGFGNATGKLLSTRMMSAGFDGVITKDKYGIGEIVDIRPRGRRGSVATAKA